MPRTRRCCGSSSAAMCSASPQTTPFLDKLVGYAVAYYQDFIKPHKRYRLPVPAERIAFVQLRDELKKLPADSDAETIQAIVFEVGKQHPETFPELRSWFQAQYEILLGQDQGPRMGSFIALYGLAETIAILDRVLAGEDLSK